MLRPSVFDKVWRPQKVNRTNPIFWAGILLREEAINQFQRLIPSLFGDVGGSDVLVWNGCECNDVIRC